MPKFLEKKLKEQYGKDSKVPYKVMNKLGYMKGNKETAKGKAAGKKHAKDTKGGKGMPMQRGPGMGGKKGKRKGRKKK